MNQSNSHIVISVPNSSNSSFMKRFLAILVIIIATSVAYAADNAVVKPGADASGSGAHGAKDKLKVLDAAARADKSETREALTALAGRLDKETSGLEVDGYLLKAARDKSLDWKTRFLILERIERGAMKKISKDEELSLYSDILQDGGEHKENRKRAAQALMEPARSEPKARKALEKAAKDKTLPDDVLWSVMVSVGSSGIDDVDTLAGLMERKPKDSNDIGINLNAVRALGQSKDPRAVGMLFKILDESGPNSYYGMTALDQFSNLIRDSEKEKELHSRLAPRLLKFLEDRSSHIGASRWLAGRMLVRMHERKAIRPIMKWLKLREEVWGGTDVAWAAEILAEFQAKEAIPELEKVVADFSSDPSWADLKRISEERGLKFPDELARYKGLRECLKKLKGEEYDRSSVTLPWDD